MKSKFIVILLSCCFSIISATTVRAWGIYGHQHIIKAAIFALPADIGAFFYDHADFLVEESTVPDIRKSTMQDKAEPNRHYIDLEAYNYTTVKAMPQTMKEADSVYNKDTMLRDGILPWHIQEMMQKLTDAFKNKRKTEILFLAADLSHYIADAHMPLHTTINHNGQFTDQKGIHAFWESQLPEMFGNTYNLYTGEAHFIPNITDATWAIIENSHKLADTMLLKERKLKNEFPKDNMYLKDSAGNLVTNKWKDPIHSPAYTAKYHEVLSGMVERQMRAAVAATADFWYTAWVNAGKPDLTTLDAETVQERNMKYYKEDKQEWKKGKLTGFDTRQYEFPQ